MNNEIVTKPWGEETIFAALDGLYVGKIIRVHAKQQLSCQVHREKTETMHFLSGQGWVELDGERIDVTAGVTVHIPAGAVHCVYASSSLVFAEVSTAYAGWRTDITRIGDRYGREGTVAQ